MVYAVGKRKCLDPPTKNVVDGLWLMGLAYRLAVDRLFRERVTFTGLRISGIVTGRIHSSVRLPDKLSLCCCVVLFL